DDEFLSPSYSLEVDDEDDGHGAFILFEIPVLRAGAYVLGDHHDDGHHDDGHHDDGHHDDGHHDDQRIFLTAFDGDLDPIDTLSIETISQASAQQRAGRAGRTGPGLAIRLWSETEQLRRSPRTQPEIERVDLCEVVLTLAGQGIEDPRSLRWLEAPPEQSLHRAQRLLEDLGAIEGGELTGIGRRLLHYPLHPRFGKMLAAAESFGCVREACRIAALCQGRPIFVRRRSRSTDFDESDHANEDDSSDFQGLLRGLDAARAQDFRADACAPLGINGSAAREAWKLSEQFLAIAERLGLKAGGEPVSMEALAKTILAGFVDQVGVRVGAGAPVYDIVHGRRGRLAPESVVAKAPVIVAVEIAEIEGKDLQVHLRKATAIDPAWLRELYPGHFEQRVSSRFDPQARRVVARRETRFRDLVLESKGAGEPPEDEAATLLAAEVAEGNLVLKKWDHGVEQWICRLKCLSQWMPELELPGFEQSDRLVLLEEIVHGARSYREIRDRPVKPALKKWLSAPQHASLEAYAPERITLANDRGAKITYDPAGAPSISVLLQNLYGVEQTPRIANGTVPLLVHILAPNQRPVQTTSDLASFWKTGYSQVKKDLAGRYPKHEWR
ncbi:MAG: ATP-dependent helicase C-terminal domain-containing protein, partial [Verrucomicrobiales bacterium]